MSITWVIHDLDLGELNLRLAYLKAGPIFGPSLSVTISSILQSELVLSIGLYFIDSYKVVIVVEFFYCWKVSVLIFLDWPDRF